MVNENVTCEYIAKEKPTEAPSTANMLYLSVTAVVMLVAGALV